MTMRNISMGGKYYKKKYIQQKIARRRLTTLVLVICLGIFSLGAIYAVDYTIRKNMLPSAPALLEIKFSEKDGYSMAIFGKSFDISWINTIQENLSYALYWPTSVERIIVFVNTLITGEQPPTHIMDNYSGKKFV